MNTPGYPEELSIDYVAVPPYAGYVPTFTSLFRPQGIDIAWGLARSKGIENGLVISAASGQGAEIDSFLAYHNKEKLGGRLSIKGLDISSDVIAAAHQAKYVVYPIGRRKQAIKQLSIYGFEVDVNFDDHCLAVDSQPVRNSHDVEFIERDLTDVNPIEGQADMVIANNVLYHLEPEQATQFITNIAGMLSANGVLSIGDIGGSDDRSMGVWDSPSKTFYHDWLIDIGQRLKTSFGLNLEVIERRAEGLKIALFYRA